MSSPKPFQRHWLRWSSLFGAISAAATLLLSGCKTPPPPPEPPQAATPPPPVSQATRAFDYRHDAATHIYSLNMQRIWKGKLSPMLYAIGTLQVSIDVHGDVRSLHWVRAPAHAPEVVAEIERTVRAAAPYPAPVHMGRVTWTDTWLWDKSGQFQLDTLSEGQLSSM